MNVKPETGTCTLLEALIINATLSKEQAITSLLAFTEFATEQYPILRGNINAFVQEELKSIRHLENSVIG